MLIKGRNELSGDQTLDHPRYMLFTGSDFPLLSIEKASLRMMLSVSADPSMFPEPQASIRGDGKNYVSDISFPSGVAAIPVRNILSYRKNLWSYLFGGTTYEEIRQKLLLARTSSSISAIVLHVDSPGGTIAGLFDLVDEIYQSRGVKPIYAIIDESAHSAAYAIASAADKVYIPRLGQAGSIGVQTVHIDESAANQKAGLKYTYLYAGAHKIDGTPHSPLTDAARMVFQKHVDQTYDLLIETIARNRGLKSANIRAQQSASYMGKKAVAAGLADAVLSLNDALKMITNTKNQKTGRNGSVSSAAGGTQVCSTVGLTSPGGDNLLLADAKRRAKQAGEATNPLLADAKRRAKGGIKSWTA